MSNKANDGTEFPWTAPKDVRFANVNITRYCFQMFYDYHRCIRLFSKTHQPCDIFKKTYTSICPHVWIATFEERVANGTFPLDLPEEQQPKKK